MRQFYLLVQKGAAMLHQLTWSHIIELLPLNDVNKINYYIWICVNQNISYRQLHERIKSKEYERIGYREEMENSNVNTLIKDPILIKVPSVPNKLTEYVLHNILLENIDDFLKELGVGFTYVGNKVKIKIGGVNHEIDFLLYNYEFNCFVVVELKVTDFHESYIGQILKYMGYIDKHVKKEVHDSTVGIIICKSNDGLVLNYINSEGVYVSTYELGRV